MVGRMKKRRRIDIKKTWKFSMAVVGIVVSWLVVVVVYISKRGERMGEWLSVRNLQRGGTGLRGQRRKSQGMLVLQKKLTSTLWPLRN